MPRKTTVQGQHDPERNGYERRALTPGQEQDVRRQLYEQRIATLAGERETMRFLLKRIEETAAGHAEVGEALTRIEAEHLQAEFAVEQIEREIVQAREQLAAL